MVVVQFGHDLTRAAAWVRVACGTGPRRVRAATVRGERDGPHPVVNGGALHPHPFDLAVAFLHHSRADGLERLWTFPLVSCALSLVYADIDEATVIKLPTGNSLDAYLLRAAVRGGGACRGRAKGKGRDYTRSHVRQQRTHRGTVLRAWSHRLRVWSVAPLVRFFTANTSPQTRSTTRLTLRLETPPSFASTACTSHRCFCDAWGPFARVSKTGVRVGRTRALVKRSRVEFKFNEIATTC